MQAIVSDWLNSRDEQTTFYEGDDPIVLKRQSGSLLLAAQLTSTCSDNTALQRWMRLGFVSLNHFQGALARKADNGALWLIQSLQGEQREACVLVCLEALLNQRDTWRAACARFAHQPRNLRPTSLRSLSY
ncbi:hypothetical protein cym2001_08970 [Pseudomonas sp. CYM-20-01]|jgi:hypothetical protein|nr:type III secretion protein [Pseudomonas sp. CYM-20-01]BDB17532.1 hypothetical protein cym2001_08970 [Pseudomonas sp. CYM-20-01]